MKMIIKITKIIDDDVWPAVVECKFCDAYGQEHIIYEKFPIVTAEIITLNSVFPKKGVIRCSLLNQWFDKDAGPIIKVSTELPDYVEIVDGLSEFCLLAENIVE